jgi:hypothetical protein
MELRQLGDPATVVFAIDFHGELHNQCR